MSLEAAGAYGLEYWTAHLRPSKKEKDGIWWKGTMDGKANRI